MELPFVTVLICNYNYSSFLKNAIESALNQDYPNERYGIVIVDDASTDDSWEKIENLLFFSDYEPVKSDDFEGKITKLNGVTTYAMRLNKNGGPSRARNFGIRESIEGTDWFCVLDADDIMFPNKISTLVNYIHGIENVGAIYADYEIFDIDKQTVTVEYKEPFDRMRLMQECIVHSGSMINKKALLDSVDQFGFYDEHMRTCEDYELWIRISEKYMIFHCPEILTLVRNHNSNSTNSVDESIWQQNWQRIAAKIQARNGQK